MDNNAETDLRSRVIEERSDNLDEMIKNRQIKFIISNQVIIEDICSTNDVFRYILYDLVKNNKKEKQTNTKQFSEPRLERQKNNKSLLLMLNGALNENSR